MDKLNVCVLFGGVSPEHQVSLRSAEWVLNKLNTEKYRIYPVGITRQGHWILFGGTDYSMLPTEEWLNHPENSHAVISPECDKGLLCFNEHVVETVHIDVVFPVLHGENGEDGSIQGLLQLAGIPYVGSHVSASAVAMDKTLTKLVIDKAGIPQAAWILVRNSELAQSIDTVLDTIEARFLYPVFVKPAGTGSSVGVSKAHNRDGLRDALLNAGRYDEKILVEEFIDGAEIEVAVMGNQVAIASVCGEIDAGAEFYDYETKYTTDTSVAYIPARVSEETAQKVREYAVKVYKAVGCTGLSRVDFFVTFSDEHIVFNEINTLPGFTSISMYPKLFEASGIPCEQLIDKLLEYAMEACR